MNEQVKWTYLTQEQIAQELEKKGFKVSVTVVKQLLKKHHYVKRKAQKKKATGSRPGRNEQFENIARLQQEFREAGQPIISFDSKKKEYLGSLYREGTVYTTQTLETHDHDFPSLATGVVIPHGIYDEHRNAGYLTNRTSRDTSEFACESLKQWWQQVGQFNYPEAYALLALCDCGGSNNARHYIFNPCPPKFGQ